MSKNIETSRKKNKDSDKGKAVARMPPRNLPPQPAPSNAIPMAGNAPTSFSNTVQPPRGNAYIPEELLESAADYGAAVPRSKKCLCEQIEDSTPDVRMVNHHRKKLSNVIAITDRDLKLREQSNELERNHLQARLIRRMINPFRSPFEAFNFGLNSDGDICVLEWDSDRDDEDRDEDLESGMLSTSGPELPSED
ncbi:hypothetical protein OH77DRAFT_1439152 [Trametes cingulata]|nr:hypothetical protein OH77DRAFT_1439152 [Trametes cingulata]